MRGLSIRQPWAWAILHAGKRIENRSWASCHYRGPLLIHAAKGCTKDEYEDAWDAIFDASGLVVPPLVGLHRGGIVGACRVVDVVRSEEDADRVVCEHPPQGLWFCGPLGIVLADVRPLPFVPFKGSLGFFDVPDGLFPEGV